MKPFFLRALSLFLLIGSSNFISFAQKSTTPWRVEELTQTPQYEQIFEENGVVGIVYKSAEYRGEAKNVFAYYATPGTLAGDRSLDKDLPAIVCVHGGGCFADASWVKRWAKRGYAALAMDLRGYGKGKVELPGGYQEGEERITPHFVGFEDQSEDWFYQAVSDVIAAHSLILSFPEVDPTKSAITGISWGGVITNVISGLDHRFKVAVPVYGCGYLYRQGHMAPNIAEADSVARKRWYEEYDPSLHVGNSRIPMLYVNGTNDRFFFVKEWSCTTDLVKDKIYSMRLNMKHNGVAGAVPEEIFTFVNNTLGVNQYREIPTFDGVKYRNGRVSAKVAKLKEGDELSIIYTTSTPLDNFSEWEAKELNFSSSKHLVKLDLECTACYINVKAATGENFSSKVLFKD